MILLSGSSGSGKSTIFQAIYWCLFGSLRNIYNNADPVKCMVTLDFTTFTIYRQGKPGLLRITYKTDPYPTYEDDVAQQIIHQLFGKKEVWKACCYIEQGGRCALLSGSNNEKMDLLNNLSFANDDPDACIAHIDTELKNFSSIFRDIQTEFKTKCDIFSNELTQHPVKPETMSHLSEHSILITRSHNLTKELQQLHATQLEQHRIQGTHSILTKNLNDKEEELKKYESVRYLEPSNSLLEHLTKIKDEYNQLAVVRLEQQKLRGSYQTISETLKNKIENRDMIPRVHEDEIKTFETEIENIRSIIDKATSDKIFFDLKNETIDTLQKLEITLDKYLSTWRDLLNQNYSPEDIWKLSEQEKNYQQYSSTASGLNVEYNQIAINNEINKLQSELQLSSQLQVLFQIQELERQLEPLKFCKTEEIEVSQSRDKYNQLRQGLDILQCPHCNGSVRIINNNLVVGDINPVTQDQVQESYNEVMRLTNEWENNKRSKILQKQLDDVLIRCNNRAELEQKIKNGIPNTNNHQNLLNQLYSIQIVDKPSFDPKILGQIQMYKTIKLKLEGIPESGYIPDIKSCEDELNTLLKKHEHLKKNFNSRNSLSTDIEHLELQLKEINIPPDVDDRYNSLKVEIDFYTDRYHERQQYEKITSEIDNIKIQIDKLSIIPDIDVQVKNKESELETLNNLISEVEYAQKMVTTQKKLENMQAEINIQHQQLGHLQKLRQTAIDVECQQLQNTVDAINSAMTEILNNIFDSPITVILKLYKQLKTDKRTKPSVNMTISYRGIEYDSITTMSGGEADRISFALILALNRVSISPLLILDESMASLNADLREACTDSLRNSVCGTKTVLCVNHEDIEGNYDEVIHF